MRSVRVFSSILVLICALFSLPAQGQTHWKVAGTLPIGSEGGWDYINVDSTSHRLFVTRTTHTLVIDANTGKTLGDIPGQTRAHGVALAPALNRGFISDGGGDGAIIVFDLTTYAVLGHIIAIPDADGIIYDASTNQILVAAGDSEALITLKADADPTHGKIDPPIALGGKPEFLAADGHGRAYVNIEDKDIVAAVDLKTRKVVSRWPVAPGGHPVGLAIDNATRRLFIGCRSPQKLVVMSTETGKVEASLPIGAGVDATAYLEGQAFASCGDGSLTVAGVKESAIGLDQTIATPRGARTLAVDEASHRIYLPTADFEPATTGRPKAKPGTFKIVVVERY